jgi:hypothetical protein
MSSAVSAGAWQPRAKQAKAFGDAPEDNLGIRVVLGLKPGEGLPVHPLGFVARQVQNARLPAQSAPDLVGLASRTVFGTFPLAPVDEALTVSAGDSSSSIQNSHSAIAIRHRTSPPDPIAAQMAGCPIQLDGIGCAVPLPISQGATVLYQDQVRLHIEMDGRNLPRSPGPGPPVVHVVEQAPASLHLADVKLQHVLGAGLGSF